MLDVEMICVECNSKFLVKKKTYQARLRRNALTCILCSNKVIAQKNSINTKKLWESPDYSIKMKTSLDNLQNQENKEKRIEALKKVQPIISEKLKEFYSEQVCSDLSNKHKKFYESLSIEDKKDCKSRAIKHLNNLTEEQKRSRCIRSKNSQLKIENIEKQRKYSIDNMTDEWRNKVSKAVLTAYEDPVKAARMLIRLPRTKEQRQAISLRMIELWKTKKYKEKWVDGIALSKNHNWISTYQKIFYSICDDLNLKFYKEPENVRELSFDNYKYRCDALIIADKPLIVFIHGDYWHRFHDNIKQKDVDFKKYFDENLSDKYDLMIIWEHEFLSKNRIRDKIVNQLGLNKERIIINKKDLLIKKVDKKISDEFLSKYHYMSKGGRRGYCVGLYFNDILIGISEISNITRKETADRLKLLPHQIQELSRFCLHPGYTSHNLASWFLTKSINMFKKEHNEVNYLISFADEGFNHVGTVYKASNWILDGEVEPTYWYMDVDGHILHKKTLYVHARSIRMKESVFADKFCYRKIYTGKRFRFIKKLNEVKNG